MPSIPDETRSPLHQQATMSDMPTSADWAPSNSDMNAFVLVATNGMACMLHFVLYFLNKALRRYPADEVIIEAVTGSVNASFMESHQVVQSDAFYAFVAVRIVVYITFMATFGLVFLGKRANDAFVLALLLRSPPAILLVLRVVAFVGVTACGYADRAMFDPFAWLDFMMYPVSYSLGVCAVILGDANRVAQRARWVYYVVCLFCTTVLLVQVPRATPLAAPAPLPPSLCSVCAARAALLLDAT
jgi:hypothetical protein